MHFLVSELRRFQNAQCNDKKKIETTSMESQPERPWCKNCVFAWLWAVLPLYRWLLTAAIQLCHNLAVNPVEGERQLMSLLHFPLYLLQEMTSLVLLTPFLSHL